jgi:hypothetical protein
MIHIDTWKQNSPIPEYEDIPLIFPHGIKLCMVPYNSIYPLR